LKVVLVFAISWALLFYTGLGLTRLLSFPEIRGQEILLAPLVGMSLIVPVGYWCASAGRPAAFTLVLTLILSTVLNVLSLGRHEGLPIRPHLPLLVASALTFALAVVPLARLGHLGPIGSNGDQVLYSNVTAYLEHGGLPTPAAIPSRPAVVQLSFVNWGLPLGFNYLHALVDEITGLKAHESFSLVTAVLLSLNVLGLSFLARSVFGLGPTGTLLTALLTAASPTFLWVHYNDFGMHVTSLGLVPVALGVAALSLQEGSARAWLLSALLLSAAFTSYPFATAPIALAPLTLYALLLHLVKRAPLATTLKRVAGIGALAILLNVPGILHVVKLLLPMFRFILVKEFGDISEHVSWWQMYGVVHHAVSPAPFPFGSLPALSALLGLIALGITVYGFRQMVGHRRLLFLALALAYVPFYVWLRFVLDYPYGAFKALTSSTFAAILGLAFGAERLLDRGHGGTAASRALVGTFLVLLVLTNVSFAARMTQTVRVIDLSPLADVLGAGALARGGETIHVRDDRDTDLLWVTYFLKDHDLFLAHYSPYYMVRDWPFYRNAIDTDLVLVRKPASLDEPWASEVVHENSRYRLIRKDRGVLAHLDFDPRARVLKTGQRLEIRVSPDRIDVDRAPFPLGTPLVGKRGVVRLGIFAPEGATLRLSSASGEELIRVQKDLEVLDQPITRFPLDLTLVNEGARSVVAPGWLEVVDAANPGRVKPGALFHQGLEEVLPGSGFFVVDGWYGLEPGPQRWTAAASVSVFRNPFSAVALSIRGGLPDLPGVEARVTLNDRQLGTLREAGEVNATFPVPPEVLGSSGWGDLEITVNRTFNPHALKLSSDRRDLGVRVTRIGFESLTLPPDGIIDFRGERARAYLGSGWSRPEQWGDHSKRWIVWANAPESTVWFAVPGPADLTVSLRLLPFTFPSSPPQTVKAFINGYPIAGIALPGSATWHTYTLDLPRSHVLGGVNTLRFVYGYLASPSKVLPDSADSRTLAVAFDSLEFRETRYEPAGPTN
jgi:hypothetical protein